MFSESEGYERFMGRWSRRLAPLFVDFAGVEVGNDVLDVGCGTGALTFAAATVPAVRAVGVDPSSEFVRAAQRAGDGDRVRFQVGDASALPFPDASFDRTLSMLVLNFVPDTGGALREMIRVTRPNGVVAAAVWDYGDGMEMLRVFWDEAVALDPAAAGRDERHMPLSRRGELSALWQDLGHAQRRGCSAGGRHGVRIVRRLLAALPLAGRDRQAPTRPRSPNPPASSCRHGCATAW